MKLTTSPTLAHVPYFHSKTQTTLTTVTPNLTPHGILKQLNTNNSSPHPCNEIKTNDTHNLDNNPKS
jgi:hypothetical protein